jgi:hypothetical protein
MGRDRAGYPEPAAAAVICFECLQRPENVLAGYVRWPEYRGNSAPNAIKIEHHKTGAKVLHPLQDHDGTRFYPEAEAVLAKLPRAVVCHLLAEILAVGVTLSSLISFANLAIASGQCKRASSLISCPEFVTLGRPFGFSTNTFLKRTPPRWSRHLAVTPLFSIHKL